MARCRLASSSPLCQEVINPSAPFSTPACKVPPPPPSPPRSRLTSGLRRRKARRPWSPGWRRTPSGRPSGISASSAPGFPYPASPLPQLAEHQPFRESPVRLSRHGPRKEQAPLPDGGLHALAADPLQRLGVGALLAPVADDLTCCYVNTKKCHAHPRKRFSTKPITAAYFSSLPPLPIARAKSYTASRAVPPYFP